MVVYFRFLDLFKIEASFHLAQFCQFNTLILTMARGNYTEEKLRAAVKAVDEDGISYGDAAKLFNIPKPTIHKYSKETIVMKPVPGRAPVLTPDEEGALEKWCLDLAELGFPRTDQDLLNQVEKIIKADGRETTFSSMVLIFFCTNFMFSRTNLSFLYIFI